MHVYSKSTAVNGVLLARAYEEIITNTSGNTYAAVGQSWDWGTKPEVDDSIENLNTVFRNIIAAKKINSSDVNLVIPDNSWATGIVYDQFNSDEEMYTHDGITALTGTINYTSGSNTITSGANTTFFTTELLPGDIVEFSGLTVDETKIRRQIISITDNNTALINSSISTTFTNSILYKVESFYPRYAKKFYVRNSYDQVFICIFNKGGSTSTVEPVLRPENFSIGKLVYDSSDGYIWRYLYTVPSGLKEKFFYTDSEGIRWIPVTTDTIVSSTAIDGAIENIRIIDGGTGYNSNTPDSAADIITVTGDGTGASFFATVTSSSGISTTTISDIVSANPGSGYTYATLTASGGTGANLIPLISPVGGFGLDPAKDLGAKYLGITVEFAGNVSGYLPVSSSAGNTKFRQVSIISNPQYTDGTYIDAASVSFCSNVKATFNPSDPVSVGDIFVQGDYSARVVAYYSGSTAYFTLNNIKGTFSNNASFYVGTQTRVGSGLLEVSSNIKRSGDILYVENLDLVTRNSNQYEQVKLVLKF